MVSCGYSIDKWSPSYSDTHNILLLSIYHCWISSICQWFMNIAEVNSADAGPFPHECLSH